LSSTAAVYGKEAVLGEADGAGRIPEGSRARSRTAYGWSKRLAERVTLGCTATGLETLVARPYNHAGPGQTAGYVVPDLAAEIRAALAEGRPARTGSLWPERDLLHLDDVIDAYLLLLERGEAGRIYDIARGEAVAIQAIYDGLVRRLGEPVGHEVDPAKARSGELNRI
jgi:GDP-4-dehydro-6-deoxy-D-mannose reductase